MKYTDKYIKILKEFVVDPAEMGFKEFASWYDTLNEDEEEEYWESDPPYTYGYVYWQALKSMPKKPITPEKPTIKRVSDDYVDLWSEFGYMANVKGIPVGVNLEEGMDYDKVWFFQRLDVPHSENIETSWEKNEKMSFAEEMIDAINLD